MLLFSGQSVTLIVSKIVCPPPPSQSGCGDRHISQRLCQYVCLSECMSADLNIYLYQM